MEISVFYNVTEIGIILCIIESMEKFRWLQYYTYFYKSCKSEKERSMLKENLKILEPLNKC